MKKVLIWTAFFGIVGVAIYAATKSARAEPTTDALQKVKYGQILLKSENGVIWQLRVDNSGILLTDSVGYEGD